MTITELIKQTEMTDTDLGSRIGVAAVTVYRWRVGQRVPDPRARKSLCRLARVGPADVVWKRAAIAAE